MGFTLSGVVTLGLLIFLSIGLNNRGAEGCSCFPDHPQKLFCTSEIVMRAEIIGEKIITKGDDIPGLGTIQYAIKVIKVFRGFERLKEIQYVYTYSTSSLCGIRLDHSQYLLSGHMMPEGFFVSLCDFVERWDSLSLMLKQNLKFRYQMGCDCMISTCIDEPCHANSNTECVLTDWTGLWPTESDEAVHEYACIKHNNGSCSWYTGSSNPTDNNNMTVAVV